MTPEQQLEDAKEQYHALMTGQKPRVLVDQNGERIEFTATNAAKLQLYIASLERQISSKSSGPAGVFF